MLKNISNDRQLYICKKFQSLSRHVEFGLISVVSFKERDEVIILHAFLLLSHRNNGMDILVELILLNVLVFSMNSRPWSFGKASCI